MHEDDFTGSGDALDPDAEIVAIHISEGKSDAEATLAIGRQAKWAQRRRRDDPAFVRRIEELKAARVSAAAAGLGALLERAVGTVERNLDAPRASDQLRAAGLVFDRYPVFRDAAGLASTLEAMRSEIETLRAEVRRLQTERGAGAVK